MTTDKKGDDVMRRSNFALRLPPSLIEEARKAAESQGIALNQLIMWAVAEKVSAMRTAAYFEERARRADLKRFDKILAHAGKGNPPAPGDELPPGYKMTKLKRKKK